jgi:3-oxoacyl-[acyl-carrier-protein] synthase-1
MLNLALRAAIESAQQIRSSLRGNGAASIALPPGSSGLTSLDLEVVTARLNGEICEGKLRSTETFATGHAAGIMALQWASSLLDTGKTDWCIVGGVDSYLDVQRLESLDENDELHSANNPWGIIPGEAAAFCIVTTERFAFSHAIEVLARVESADCAYEEQGRSGAVCLGEGLTAVFRSVLAAIPETEKVGGVICDMNGEPSRTDEYGFTIARLSNHFKDASDVVTPADCWGDVGAASGLLFLGLAIVAARKHYAKGPRTLLWSSSKTGERAAALICT